MGETMPLMDVLIEHFRGLEARRGASAPNWLSAWRREQLERFSARGWPTTREESWRDTNVAPIARIPFRHCPAGADTATAATLPVAAGLGGGDVPRLVFVDGRYSPGLSSPAGLPAGVRAGSLAAALEADPETVRPLLTGGTEREVPAFRALNAALHEDGAFVHVPDGVALERPLHLVFVSGAPSAETPSVSHPRTILVLGRTARATVVESYVGHGEATYLTNAVTGTHLGDAADLRHLRLQLESRGAYHLSAVEAVQGRDSRYSACHINLGGRIVRNDLRVTLDGEGGNTTLDGLSVTGDEQHLDNHTVLDHARPHCDSRELFKSILGGASRTVFNGRIVVREGAQKTDAKQSNPNLLLSPDALAHTRPQLEIYADDVRCTHGATIGRLDEDAVFYLRSRGVPADAARRLLVEAFAGEILDTIAHEPLRDDLSALVGRRLAEV